MQGSRREPEIAGKKTRSDEKVKLMYQEKWEEWGEKAGEKFLKVGQGCGGMLWRRRDTGSMSRGEGGLNLVIFLFK